MKENKDILEEVKEILCKTTSNIFDEAIKTDIDEYNRKAIESSIEKIIREIGVPENRVGVSVKLKDGMAYIDFKDMKSGKLIAVDEVNELLSKYGEVELNILDKIVYTGGQR